MNKKPTIYEALWAKLGRQPTSAEITEEVRRIIQEAHAEVAAKKKLPYQRSRRG